MDARVVIGEPIWRYNLGRAQMSTKAMMLAAGGLLAGYVPGGIKLGRLDLTREQITKTYMEQARALGGTHLLMIDQDIVFPQDLVERLVSRNLPLVSALYLYRDRERPLPLIFNFGPDGTEVIAEWWPG